MLNSLSQGIKISITRSISHSFEQYMNMIKWDEEKFDMNKFVEEWRNYIQNQASWYGQLSEEIKSDPVFHEQLAIKMNETINKLLSEKPTEEQMEEIEQLQSKTGKEYNYSCKLEAKYVIQKLKSEL